MVTFAILKVLAAVFTLAMLLVVWFRTNALTEYLEQLNLDSHTVFDNFKEYITDNPVYFPEFLKEFYGSNFWIKLITCHKCISVWMAIPVSILFGLPLSGFLAVSFLGLLSYLVFTKLDNNG